MGRFVNHYTMLLLTLALGWGGIGFFAPVQAADPSIAQSLGTLTDGDYQWCTQPPPSDWRDGAGVCLRFLKRSNQIRGYYGYPHSDRFICLQGQVSTDPVKGDRVVGQAMDIAWAGEDWSEIPKQPFTWDEEGHLNLANGKLVSTTPDRAGGMRWIVFEAAQLEMKGFYAYPKAKMTPVEQLCSPWMKRD